MKITVRTFTTITLLFAASLMSVLAVEQSQEEIVAAFPKNFPPEYQLSPEGAPYGFAIEVMQEVERRAGIKIQYTPVNNWSIVTKMIKDDQAQIVPNVGISPERRKLYFFTDSYESFNVHIFINKSTRSIKQLKDLVGKKVGTTKTNIANKLVGDLTLIHYDNAQSVIQALVDKQLDAIILPDTLVYRIASQMSVAETLLPVGNSLQEVQRAIAVSRQHPELFKKIDQIMREYLNSEEFADTQESWLKSPQANWTINDLIKLNILLLFILAIATIAGFKYRSDQLKQSFIEKKLAFRILLLIGILSIATILTSMTSIWLLYNAAFSGQQSRLMNIAQSQARMIEHVARYDLSNREPLGLSIKQSHAATISQFIATQQEMRGFGKTGEFTFAQRTNDKIEFLLRQRRLITSQPQSIDWLASEAEPMRRALSGRSGTMVGLDYQGIHVLAAYEPVAVLDAGIVAKVDLQEIREPYIRAALIALIISILILSIGVLFFVLLAEPILSALSHAYARLNAIVRYSPNLIVITNTQGKPILHSKELKNLSTPLPKAGEFSIAHNDGTEHTYITSTFPLTANKRKLGSCQIATDITERAKSEMELQQLAMAFQNAGDGILITDLKGNILRLNQAVKDITGYSEKELIGNNPKLLASGLQDETFYSNMWESIIDNGEWQGEVWNRRKNGEAYPEWLNIKTIYDENNLPSHYVGVFSDISPLKKAQNELQHVAYHDALTQLPNRILFRDRLEHQIRQAHRDNNMVALFAIDIDRFKLINDSLGHQVGDLILKRLSSQLQSLVRESDTVARMGGDEFTVIAYGFTNYQSISNLAHKLTSNLGQNLDIEGQQVISSISLGIAVYPYDGTTYEDLLKNADSALYKAKDKGRNNYQYYTEELGKNAHERLAMENQMLQGLKNDEFTLYYQAQYDMQNNKLVSAEALVRWNHPKLGLVSPDKFIPLMEENGLIVPLGEWILETACKQMKSWRNSGYDMQRISVNLSGAQIGRAGLFDIVQQVLKKVQIPAQQLELEITESFIMKNVKESIHLLKSFSKLGISIAIDDFGTGYSSLAYLKRLPVNTLKIDRSFVKDLPAEEDAAISKAVIALGHSLGMRIIAEGVEEQAHWTFLKEEGCDIAQGYLRGKPIPADQFEKQHLCQSKADSASSL